MTKKGNVKILQSRQSHAEKKGKKGIDDMAKALSVTVCERAQIKDRVYLLPDYDGLYLKVYPTGKKKWIVRMKKDGKETQKTIGQYPQMSLVEAREYRDNYKAHARYGGRDLNVPTLKEAYEAWMKSYIKPRVSAKTVENLSLRFKYAEALHNSRIDEIRREDIVAMLNDVSLRRSADTVKRVGEVVKRVLDFAVDEGKLQFNPAQRLNRSVPVIATLKKGHFGAALNRAEIKAVLDAIDRVNSIIVARALKFIAYTFVRSGELRLAKWDEINFDEKLWIIPAEHTKLKRDQLVPLSRQAIEILKDMQRRYKKKTGYIFPATRGKTGPLGRATMLTALKNAMANISVLIARQGGTIHGLRATASTLLHEAEFDHFVIERQLAHLDKNSVSAAYNRAEYLGARRKLMQWYSDALDAIQNGEPLPEKPV